MHFPVGVCLGVSTRVVSCLRFELVCLPSPSPLPSSFSLLYPNLEIVPTDALTNYPGFRNSTAEGFAQPNKFYKSTQEARW